MIASTQFKWCVGYNVLIGFQNKPHHPILAHWYCIIAVGGVQANFSPYVIATSAVVRNHLSVFLNVMAIIHVAHSNFITLKVYNRLYFGMRRRVNDKA